MSDLRQRAPGHALIDELLRQWDLGTIHVDAATDGIVIDDEAVGWYRGVIGERRVADLLSRLGSEWTVLHSVPVGAGTSDIDHIVIGESGVFTINTKYSPGKTVWSAGYGMYVDTFPVQFVRNSVTEAARASDLLSKASGMTVPVVGLIVFVDPGTMTRKAAAAGGVATPEIRVMPDAELLATFATRPIFSPEQTQRIVEQAVRPETWHRAPAPSTVGRHITQEFDALESEVGPRLARPVIRVTAPRQAPKKSYASSRAKSRPATRRPSSKRRPKQSLLEKLVRGLLMPAAGFAIVWAIFAYVSQR